MGKKTKATLLYLATFFIIFQVIRWALYTIFPNLSELYSVIVSGALSGLFAPRFDRTVVQGEEKIEVKWLFLKKNVFIN